MKEKNGFVFVETMIVVVTVLVSLLLIYSSYVSLRGLERKRVRYDDPAYIYKTYSIGKFLLSIKDENNSSVLKKMIYELESNGSENLMKYIRYDDEEWYTNSEYENNGTNYKQQMFIDLYDKLNVFNMIVISKNNIKLLEDPNSDACKKENPSENCSNVPNNFYSYIKSIETPSDNSNPYYLIVEYAEKIDGTPCHPNTLGSGNKVESSCTYYFSNLKLGGDYN